MHNFHDEAVWRNDQADGFHRAVVVRRRRVGPQPRFPIRKDADISSFRVAHAHHAWELYNIYGRTKSALQRAVLTCGQSSDIF